MYKNISSRGFSLIELLVVVSIIGLLSSFIIASIDTARTKSRNTARVTQVAQLMNAFNIARTGGAFPNTAYTYPCLSATCYGAWSPNAADATVDTYFTPYMQKPIDPPDGMRGYGGFLLMTPANWAGNPPAGFPQGYYINYLLEPGGSCGPGTLYNTTSTYVQCLLRLDA